MKFVFNVLILVAFSLCYTEWGKDHAAFIGEMEYKILFQRSGNDAANFSHPVVLAGLFGQVALLAASFRIPFQKKIHISGVVLLSIVPLLILIAGILSVHFKMLLSTLPFFLLIVLYYHIHYKKTGERYKWQ